ncbi:hypothetical protein Vadar_000837 [Vaccinium darrowii]|uniref:Uncharacterized protein n=1 Tax=Vaccinium darrowii TaxID=229202 RepID=A0ACB7WWG3_9ERIC|nr:hypothetical protein Vadar_000837 [Vaccinium darrowii]
MSRSRTMPTISTTASLKEAPADLKNPNSSATSLDASAASETAEPKKMLRRRRRGYRVLEARREKATVRKKVRKKQKTKRGMVMVKP